MVPLCLHFTLNTANCISSPLTRGIRNDILDSAVLLAKAFQQKCTAVQTFSSQPALSERFIFCVLILVIAFQMFTHMVLFSRYFVKAFLSSYSAYFAMPRNFLTILLFCRTAFHSYFVISFMSFWQYVLSLLYFWYTIHNTLDILAKYI